MQQQTTETTVVRAMYDFFYLGFMARQDYLTHFEPS